MEEYCRAPRAFTLIELLLVIAIIAILAAMLLPALNRVRSEGKRITCENHLKQLALCVPMYAADNAGRLPDNNPGAQPENTWVPGNLLRPSDATNQVLIRQSKLFPYANHPGVYRCPADPSQSNGLPRVRSYSMNGWVGSRYMDGDQGSAGYPKFRTFVRDTELGTAGPANIWLIIDEHELSINDAWFQVTMNDSQPFASYPATRHERAYCLNFGDGHVEQFKLRDPESLKFGARDATFTPRNLDWLRLKQFTTIR